MSAGLTKPQTSAIGLPARLTPREAEVAQLIGDGLFNRDIAVRLILSERTVHAHVRSILSKLGLRSRTQVAVWVTQRGEARAARGGRPRLAERPTRQLR